MQNVSFHSNQDKWRGVRERLRASESRRSEMLLLLLVAAPKRPIPILTLAQSPLLFPFSLIQVISLA